MVCKSLQFVNRSIVCIAMNEKEPRTEPGKEDGPDSYTAPVPCQGGPAVLEPGKDYEALVDDEEAEDDDVG